MGAIAEAMMAYAEPLLEETDGSIEDTNRALMLSQLCWNMALLPDDQHEKFLCDMRSSVEMDGDEFDDFRQGVIGPMIRRHREMFPLLHQKRSTGVWDGDPSLPTETGNSARAEKYPGTERYAPCPCNSGRKYKFCCGAKGR
jgi:hypothetical protein